MPIMRNILQQSKIFIVAGLIVLVGGCAAQHAQSTLLLKAPTIESNPSSFSESWGNGRTLMESDHTIVRKESKNVYIITPEKNGKRDGVEIRYRKTTKKIVSETSYKNGLREGLLKKYSPEGGWLYETILYRHGKKAEVKEYNQKGQMVHFTPYLDGEKHGVEQRFSYTHGSLISRVTYEHGTARELKSYCSNGRVSLKIQLDGCRDGLEESWYCETGILKRKTPYRNCKRNGVEKRYDKAGHLQYAVNYRNGLEQGAVKEYYPNGNIKYELNYHKGKANEIGYYYNNDGKKERIDYDTLMHFCDKTPEVFSIWEYAK